MFQVLLHYRAARYQDFVNLSQQIHLYNQRVVAGLNKCTRNVPFDRINTREIHSNQLGPMPMPMKKLCFRLDQIPFYDTKYMVDPVNLISRQSFPGALLSLEDEESWDSPLQRNPSMTSCLLTYNAYKKEQACQTNWDHFGEDDLIYNQNFYRDPQLLRRSQMQKKMNSYSVFNSHHNNYSNQNWGNRSGSRRNSLKDYAAPPPPPMPDKNRYRHDSAINTSPSYKNRFSFTPTDHVRELKDMERYSSNADNSDDAPFNFKAILRKTNYQKPASSTTYKFNSRIDSENNDSYSRQQPFQNVKLNPIGRRYNENVNNSYNGVAQGETMTRELKKFENNNAKSFEETGSYVEEEIAPGVTLSGYAVDI